MPELPEVESIKIQLNKFLVGHRVSGVDVRFPKAFQGDEKSLIGGKVKQARRFGKVTVIDFDNGYSLVIHIKLTGQLIYRGPNLKTPPKLSPKIFGGLDGKHTVVIFRLDRGGKLYYNDFRKFGWLKIVKTKEVGNIDFIKKLGPEPLGSLTHPKFKEITGSTGRAIKTLIMDQSKMAGVGNIYANDALYLAKIHPERKANSLTEDEVKTLYEAVEKVLRRGLKYGGASELSFVTPDGSDGKYQEHTLIYGKTGEKCKRCGGVIKKNTVGGRGTYFCPSCQPA
ncbi:MAG: Formamidopyrimidine-DNA glycosylase [Candidatus Woesebacteria bacterium GW2011_GWA1_39_21]|uniref:Formamidopyrimidine-DNA glycosylase n=1 Tax=Candidatus Woesebacteria bacterium GW2011_GWA1_39_21 TaxID=1618550 RepID=A0A0G0N6Q8_9BACT|nr:MAG: Formamidopyrimidine-DNA glycosylase [Candidatus Woesebacteria bacterium GW2011_GWA1_39_21]